MLGVVGWGPIGREWRGSAAAFGMHVIAHDPGRARAPAGVELVPLAELVRRADVITLHCALTEATRGLIDRRLLARRKPGAILVNVARGASSRARRCCRRARLAGSSPRSPSTSSRRAADPAHPLSPTRT